MKYEQNIFKVIFFNEERGSERHQKFLEIFQQLIKDDQGINHLILIHRQGTFGFSYSFPGEALEKYPNELVPFKPELAQGFPDIPYRLVFGKEYLDYWREKLNWDQPGQ
jgi:hypothetical protein